MQTIHDFQLSGREALVAVIRQTNYRGLEQAVASLTMFSHPDTVAQTGLRAIFPVVRNFAKRGAIEQRGGSLVGLDDNKAPTDAFLWANAITRRPPDLQFNHIYARSDDPDCYTCLANLCASPGFLAKLTDTNSEIIALLRYRAFELYGWFPKDADKPIEPPGYQALEWCSPLLPVTNVRETLIAQVRRRADRTTRMISQTGWLFADAM
ncbi:hypothetical protein [Pelagibacterium lacus]|uniref:hypothetical protein n=1 Tax=Pelagibacterium lacus TaxID=2282655 RepID=UPI0011C05B91|nr:hypothetical protein [Pelagibacterium lacus]